MIEKHSFHHLGIAPDMLEVLDRMKFIMPTPIQHKAIPLALKGDDIIGVAQTGTGKTLAFGIPRENPEILIAPPGRMLDLIFQGAIDFHEFKIFMSLTTSKPPARSISNTVNGLKNQAVVIFA